MASKGKPSPRSAVKPLSDEQSHASTQSITSWTRPATYPTGPRTPNTAEINAQNPKATERLLEGVSKVLRNRSKVRAWGLERVPETGTFITAASHVTMYDVFVPMMSLFHMGRRPRYMAKAEMAKWPLIGKWFQLVGMQPVPRRSGQAKAIEEESIKIITSGRPLTIWPEGTVTRDPQKWVMSLKPGIGYIALESSVAWAVRCRSSAPSPGVPPASTSGGLAAQERGHVLRRAARLRRSACRHGFLGRGAARR